VDTVPFGCYRREVFSRCGRFDEDQVRTEDDEFNLRLRKKGGRILLVPEIRIDYYARERLSQVWRMYYQYGYFKPLVARKLGWNLLSLRHLIPSLFVLTLAFFCCSAGGFPGWGLWASWSWGFIWGRISPFAALAARRQGLSVIARLALVFPTLHFSYGLGFIRGLVDFGLRGKKPSSEAADLPISR
jgi:GT2 family glycosyltransferase